MTAPRPPPHLLDPRLRGPSAVHRRDAAALGGDRCVCPGIRGAGRGAGDQQGALALTLRVAAVSSAGKRLWRIAWSCCSGLLGARDGAPHR